MGREFLQLRTRESGASERAEKGSNEGGEL
jgi:hypothetical protein